ncbi:hypothetical protein [Legionella septentrionalis]|uniref:hypothetical protein n=1 Tax=Legionella septentrionalis TaxID=2498109 RepID=UPI000F8CA9D8|nr:hypothetical protein [Legionella septentrionalis]RUR11695.1 hypothetical protein ELY14_00135 [Legionella septentrionalis]
MKSLSANCLLKRKQGESQLKQHPFAANNLFFLMKTNAILEQFAIFAAVKQFVTKVLQPVYKFFTFRVRNIIFNKLSGLNKAERTACAAGSKNNISNLLAEFINTLSRFRVMLVSCLSYKRFNNANTSFLLGTTADCPCKFKWA